MGNIIMSMMRKKKVEKCFLCSKNIEHNNKVYICCTKCQISLHEYCEDTYRQKSNNTINCKCPHCKAIGSMYATK